MHVERIENTLVKRIVGCNVRGVRMRGRPRIGWMDGVESVE